MTASKTVVIGLDGAHFELLEPWLNEGYLPNIQNAIQKGISTDLHSVLPPVTSPNWKAFATGKNPGKLGIFWWENINPDTGTVYYPTNRKNAHTEFWELISKNDPVGVLGVPTTYPPKSVGEFFVSGAPDSNTTGYTYPESLEQKLKQEYNYRVIKRNRIAINEDAAVDEILNLIDSRFEVAKDLAEAYGVSLLQITTFYLNSLQHYFWDDDVTLRGWEIVDEHVGDFLESDCNLILMSDHGSNEIRTVFNVNTWLEQEGYLTLDRGISNYMYNLGITTDRLIRLAYLFRVPRIAERFVPESLIRYIPDENNELRRESKMEKINWDQTVAVASGQGPIYLTADRDTEQYEQVRSELIDELESIKDGEDDPVANRVVRGEEAYDGEYVAEGPDLVIDQASGVHIAGGIGRDETFSSPATDGWRAENKRAGLFVACGPDFGGDLTEPLSILDLAPMLLHLHGCRIPTDMDGTVPKSVFTEGSSPARHPVEYRDPPARETEIRRIRDVARRVDL